MDVIINLIIESLEAVVYSIDHGHSDEVRNQIYKLQQQLRETNE